VLVELSYPLKYEVLRPSHKGASACEHLVDDAAECPVVAVFRGLRKV
jgi:hypothetical protein